MNKNPKEEQTMNVQEALDLYKEENPDVDPEVLKRAVTELNYTKDLDQDAFDVLAEILDLADEPGPEDDLLNHGDECDCDACCAEREEDECCDEEDDPEDETK